MWQIEDVAQYSQKMSQVPLEFIYTIFIEGTQLAKITILQCDPLQHITKQ